MTPKPNRALLLIAAFKFLKGLLLVVLAVGMLRLLHRDLQEVLEHWIDALRIDPQNRYAGALLAKAGLIDDRKLAELSGLTFVYAALFLTEGVGLSLRQRWAEWLTVVATASFIPIEIYEVLHHCNALKVLLLIGNSAIVGYLVTLLRRPATMAKGAEH